MSGVQTTMALQDRLTGPLMKMMKAMDRTIDIMQRMDKAANNVDMKSLTKARSTIQSASADLERLISASSSAGAGLAPLSRSFANLPGPIKTAGGAVRSFFAGFAGATAAYLSIQAIGNGFKTFVTASDTYVSTNARLSLINDNLQTQAQLQDKVYQAAQRSRTGYNDLASSVAKLNLLAEDAFRGNDEAIRFSELMGKAFTISGAPTVERQAGMYQLTQAMAAGKLQGDEFRSIMENAPMLAIAIAEAMGKSRGELKEMSAEGVITADIIKSALFSAATDIEDQFKNLPMTFAQGWTMFKNWSQRAFEPLFIRFNQFVNSDAFGVLAGHAMTFVNIFIAGMSLMFDSLEFIYNIIGVISGYFKNNWSLFAPVLTVVAAVLGTIGVILLGMAAKWALVTTATIIATAAMWAFDTAMAAFPGTWILLAFVAVIAVVIYALIAWGDQTAVVVGFVAGLFTMLIANIYNQFAYLWNIIVSFAEFLINVFIDPTYAVQKLFYDLGMNFLKVMHNMAVSAEDFAGNFVSVILQGLNKVLGGINKFSGFLNSLDIGFNIPKVGLVDEGNLNFASNKIAGLMTKLEGMKPVTTKGVVDFNSAKLGQMNLHTAFSKGDEVGRTLTKSVSDKLNSFVDKAKGIFGNSAFEANNPNPFLDVPGMTNPIGDMNPTGGKLDRIGKIDDEISIADEDWKVMRELAERRSIQNIITLTPVVQFEGTVVREEADIVKIKNQIETIWKDEANEVTEGAFS